MAAKTKFACKYLKSSTNFFFRFVLDLWLPQIFNMAIFNMAFCWHLFLRVLTFVRNSKMLKFLHILEEQTQNKKLKILLPRIISKIFRFISFRFLALNFFSFRFWIFSVSFRFSSPGKNHAKSAHVRIFADFYMESKLSHKNVHKLAKSQGNHWISGHFRFWSFQIFFLFFISQKSLEIGASAQG
jgi:hypothetical protein